MHFVAEECALTLRLKRGDVLFWNNLGLLHCRNGFTDSTEHKRHLIRQRSLGDAVLIGHDWGAAAVWGATADPHRWRRFVAMSVPHLGSLAGLLGDYAQLKRSFYVYLFQTGLAELVAGADDLAFIDNLWRDWSPSYDGKEDLATPYRRLGAACVHRDVFRGSLRPGPADRS